MIRKLALFGGLAAAVLAGIGLDASGYSPAIALTASVTTLCAIWWIFEAIPIPATSLIPLAAFPLFGILTGDEVGAAYGSPLILLMMGGFILSTAMARSGVHRRLAIKLVRLFGGHSGAQLVLGFTVAAAAISMWISNVATALMLLPIALAVAEKLDNPREVAALMLGIMYGCSIGGIGTPVGTPPNLIFMRVYAQTTGDELTFLEWMSWAMPIVLVMTPIAAFWLTRGIPKGERIRLPESGPWRSEEVRTLAVFGVTALLWVTRKEPFGGWSAWLGLSGADDSNVALLAVVAMFLIPNGKGGKLLDWETAVTIPWGILILFGGGVAIAKAFETSGLSGVLGSGLAGINGLHIAMLVLLISIAVTFLTEITSNTATTALLMPILAAAAVAAGIDPKIIMVPAAISASFAFMLPVATGPNAVIFGSGKLTVAQMAREGFVLNLIGAVVITVAVLVFVA